MEARSREGGVTWGCLGVTYTIDYNDLPINSGMIDGNTDVDAARTCNGHSVIDLGSNELHSGVIRYYFNSQPANRAGAYSMGYSEDGQNWSRYGDCSCGEGCTNGGTLGPLGVLTQPPYYWDVEAPSEPFRYFDFSTACWDTYIREVQWIPSGTPYLL